MFLDVYIGDLDDPDFSWDDGDWNGNCPKRKSPFFPPQAPFSNLIDMIKQGRFEGKQVDWGGWVAKVKKEQILKFIEEYYPDDWYNRNFYLPHILDQMKELKRFVEKLDPDKQYALVASEL